MQRTFISVLTYCIFVIFFAYCNYILIQEALTYITKAQEQEQKLHGTNTQRKSGSARVSGVPPPPLLVCRMDKTMVFKPAPFNPSQKVRILTRLAGLIRFISLVIVRVRVSPIPI